MTKGINIMAAIVPVRKIKKQNVAQYAFWITYGSSQPGKTLQRMHSQHEAREKIFALNLYLRKKAKKPSFVRAKVEGEFRTAPRFRVGDGRPGGMQVQDRDEIIAKAHEVAEGPHDYAEFPTRLAVRLGDAQLAGNGIAFVDDILLERKLEFIAVDFCVPVFRLVLRQFCLTPRARRNVSYRILLHMRSHRPQVSPDAVGSRPLRGKAKRVLTITDWFRVLVVVISFSNIADQYMNFVCMRFLQIREGHGLVLIEKEKPDS